MPPVTRKVTQNTRPSYRTWKRIWVHVNIGIRSPYSRKNRNAGPHMPGEQGPKVACSQKSENPLLKMADHFSKSVGPTVCQIFKNQPLSDLSIFLLFFGRQSTTVKVATDESTSYIINISLQLTDLSMPFCSLVEESQLERSADESTSYITTTYKRTKSFT